MADWNELHKTMKVSEPHKKLVGFVEEYLRPGMRLLDLGCGKGRHSIYCAQKDMEVHAVDIVDSALDELRKEIEEDQLFERVKVTHADMSELPFPNEYFDAIICVNVIQHGLMKNIKQYFREASRVLKAGGRLFVITTGGEFIDEFIGPNTREVEVGTFVGLNIIDAEVPHHAFTKGELIELLKDFEEIDINSFNEHSQWMDVDVTHLEVIPKKR